MSELGAVWAALELFGSDFDRWPTVIIHSEYIAFKCSISNLGAHSEGVTKCSLGRLEGLW